MKKIYEKPVIIVEDFVLNQYIAGACAPGNENDNILINHGDLGCIEDYMGTIGYFTEEINCQVPFEKSEECTDTYIATEGYFFS